MHLYTSVFKLDLGGGGGGGGCVFLVVILLLAEVVLFPYWVCSVLSYFIKIYSQKFLCTDLFFHCVVCQVQAFQNGRPEYLLTKPR